MSKLEYKPEYPKTHKLLLGVCWRLLSTNDATQILIWGGRLEGMLSAWEAAREADGMTTGYMMSVYKDALDVISCVTEGMGYRQLPLDAYQEVLKNRLLKLVQEAPRSPVTPDSCAAG